MSDTKRAEREQGSSSPEVFFSDWEPTPPTNAVDVHKNKEKKTPLSGNTAKLEVDGEPQDQSPGLSDVPIPPVKKKKTVGSLERLQAIREALAGNGFPDPTGHSRDTVDAPKVGECDAPIGDPTAKQFKGKKSAAGSLQRLHAIQEALRGNVPSNPKGASSQVLVIPASDLPEGHAASTSNRREMASVFLTQEQQMILNFIRNGDSLFYTGSAGTGKSVLLRNIISVMRKKYAAKPDAVAVTASTGLAACAVGGVTLHSWAGVGLGVDAVKDLVQKIRWNKKARDRWMSTQVLIIDEASMVDGDFFQKLFDIAARLRTKGAIIGKPFGGIQVIVTGDFFQLPPVVRNGRDAKFAFETDAWKTTLKHSFKLTKVFRQKDQEFIDMLNEMRYGTLSPASISKFMNLARDIKYEDGILPAELYARREDVDYANSQRMAMLQTDERVYRSTDGGTVRDPNLRQKLLSDFMAPETVTLRIGAQVMLLKNLDESLVNGSLGRVLRFADFFEYDAGLQEGSSSTLPRKRKSNTIEYPVVEFLTANGEKQEILVTPETWKMEGAEGEIKVSRVQIPLLLAWALSIHKAQGQTLPRVKVDLSRVFEKGQAYVALSRAVSVDGLQVLGFDPSKVRAHPKVVEWYKTLQVVE